MMRRVGQCITLLGVISLGAAFQGILGACIGSVMVSRCVGSGVPPKRCTGKSNPMMQSCWEKDSARASTRKTNSAGALFGWQARRGISRRGMHLAASSAGIRGGADETPLDLYLRKLEEEPILTNTVGSGVIGAFGDVLAQFVTKRYDEMERITMVIGQQKSFV